MTANRVNVPLRLKCMALLWHNLRSVRNCFIMITCELVLLTRLWNAVRFRLRNKVVRTLPRLVMSIRGERTRLALILVGGPGARVSVVSVVKVLGFRFSMMLGSNFRRLGLMLMACGITKGVLPTTRENAVDMLPHVWHRTNSVNRRLWVLSRVRLLALLSLVLGSSPMIPKLSRAVVIIRKRSALLRL